MQKVVELTLDFFARVAVTFFAGVDRTHTVVVGRQLRLALQPGLAPSSVLPTQPDDKEIARERRLLIKDPLRRGVRSSAQCGSNVLAKF